MRFVWSCALKDLLRQLADPFAMALWLGMPLAIAALVVLAFGGDDAMPRAHLLIADEDSSFASRLFTDGLKRVPVIETEPASRAEGRARLEKGRASAMLIVPRGFGSAVLTGESTTVMLVTNPSQRILPRIAEETVGILAEGTYYLRRLLGPALDDLPPDVRAGRAAPSNEVVTRVSERVSRLASKLQPYLAPTTLTVETPAPPVDAGRAGDVGALFFPGILLMALLFASQGMGGDLWEEIDAGTLRRAATTPGGVAALMTGKLIAGATIMAAVCLVAAAIGVRFFAMPLARLPLVVAWGTLTGAAFLCAMLFLQTLASARRTANMLVTFILFPLLMVGGSFFPIDSLPEWLGAIGRMTPNGRAVVQLQAMIRGTTDAGGLALEALGFAAAAAALLALAVARTRRRFVRS